MFALTGGELVMVVVLFALAWGGGVLPAIGERLGDRLAKRGRGSGGGG